MKCAIVLISVVLSAFAAPEAPYPPSGWRPSGQQFSLPNRDYGTPSQEYGPLDAGTEPPTTTEAEPEGDTTTNSSRLARLPGRQSAQYNQGSSQFFVITPEGSVQQLTIPSQQERTNEPDSEQVSGVRNTAQLGQLVRLPVSSAQLRSQTPQHSVRLVGTTQNVVRGQNSQQSGRLVSSRPQQASRAQYRQPEPQGADSAQFFALTSDGRLQPVQTRTASTSASNTENQVETAQKYTQASGPSSALVLTPEGRFERLQLQPVESAQPVQPTLRDESGQYHLLLPSGKVQRVQYMNQLTPENRLASNVEYNEVQPISGPVYTYGSPLVRVL